MASVPRRYRPRGGSLVIAVLFRVLWLPLLSGGAIALMTGAREAGFAAGVVLLGVELATYRWRWAWRTLVLPTSEVPVATAADVRRQAWGYGSGVVLLCIGLAAWPGHAGAGSENAATLAGIVLGTALAAGGHVGFEHLVRNPRTPRIRARLGGDDLIDVPADWPVLLVLLAPPSLRQGAATLVMSAVMFLCGAMGMMVTAGAFTFVTTAPYFIILCMLVVAAFVPGGALVMSMIEAHHATAFADARGADEVEIPPAN